MTSSPYGLVRMIVLVVVKTICVEHKALELVV